MREIVLPGLSQAIEEQQTAEARRVLREQQKAEEEAKERKARLKELKNLKQSFPVEVLKAAANVLSQQYPDVQLSITSADAAAKGELISARLGWGFATESHPAGIDEQPDYTISWREANVQFRKTAKGRIEGYTFNTGGYDHNVIETGKKDDDIIAAVDKATLNPVFRRNGPRDYENSPRLRGSSSLEVIPHSPQPQR